MSLIEVFLYGCVGGAIPDLLRFIKARHGGPPAYAFSFYFWVMLLALVLLGGAASFFLEATDVKSALAFGFTAPEVVSRLLGGGEADRGDSGPASLNQAWEAQRKWWAI